MNIQRMTILAIITFAIVLAWIGFSVHHSFTTSTITETENIQINPIAPDFDMKTIQELSKRKKVVPVFTIESSTATTSAQPTPSSSESVLPTAASSPIRVAP